MNKLPAIVLFLIPLLAYGQSQNMAPAYTLGYNQETNRLSWFHTLSGDANAGATQGILNASTLPPALCTDKNTKGCSVIPCSSPISDDQTWLEACQTSEDDLVSIQGRETTDPIYKKGVDDADTDARQNVREMTGQATFDYCAAAGAKTGLNVAGDEQGSITRIVNLCSQEAQNWFDNCAAEPQETDSNCSMAIALDTAMAIEKNPNQ